MTLQELLKLDEYREFKDKALLALYLDITLSPEDIYSAAAEAIQDGKGDKKIDLLYFDPLKRTILIAQSYFSPESDKTQPPNKASELASAFSWIMSGDTTKLPLELREVVHYVRTLIRSGEDVDHIELAFVHNCGKSREADEELMTLKEHASELVHTYGITVNAKQYSRDELVRAYEERESQMLVQEEITIPRRARKEDSASMWTSYRVVVTGNFLSELYAEKKADLFSANVREYLGARKSKGNVNQRIKQTAQDEPENFCAFNNGITVVTKKVEILEGSTILHGVSIVNGAQTTGAISEIAKLSPECKISCRIIECTDPELIRKIVVSNNSQNPVKPSDLRSTDPTQVRIQKDFSELGLNYVTRRRSTNPKRAINMIPVGQALAAFHGHYTLSTRNISNIFELDSSYLSVFADKCTARHILLVYYLDKSIDELKAKSKQIVDNESLDIGEEAKQLLSTPSIKQYLLCTIGRCMDVIYGKSTDTLFSFKIKKSCLNNEEEILSAFAELALVFVNLTCALAQSSFYELTRSETDVTRTISSIQANIRVLRKQYNAEFEPSRKLIEIK